MLPRRGREECGTMPSFIEQTLLRICPAQTTHRHIYGQLTVFQMGDFSQRFQLGNDERHQRWF